MAKILFTDPVAAISGRTSTGDRIVFRTRNGRTHAYVVQHPNTNPPSEKQLAHTALFAATVKQARAELADPVRCAYWEKEFAAYTKRHNPAYKRPQSSNAVPAYNSRRKPPISTLYGYVFHTLYEQSKTTSAE